MLILGKISMGQCDIQPMIPKWLVISGLVGLMNFMIKIVASLLISKKNEEKTEIHIFCKWVPNFFYVILFGLLIAGNFWVYSNHSRVEYNRNIPKTYCNKNCYLFSFWIVTSINILIGIGISSWSIYYFSTIVKKAVELFKRK